MGLETGKVERGQRADCFCAVLPMMDSSNKALQPTATRCAFTFFMTETLLEIFGLAPGSRS
jgi:hypothetical protein